MEVFIAIILLGIIFYLFSKNKNTSPIQITYFQEKLKQLRIRKSVYLLKKFAQFFSQLFDYPLTDEQQKAIISESKTSMVIASAGSGKTSMIVAKYGYLLESKPVTEEEILVLAFNNKVAGEIKGRIDDLYDVDSHVYTFHSLGKKITKTLEGVNKPLDDLAREDMDGLLTTANVEEILKRARDRYPEIDTWITDFRVLCPYHKIETFAKDEKAYREAIRSYPFRREPHQLGEQRRQLTIPSMNRKYFLKSQEELAIANHLIRNGVKFEYEKPFPIPHENPDYGVYRPDFYYPEIDLWHEHFALDRDGNPPIAFKGYKEEAEWKKEFHELHGTNIFYTYSYQFNEDTALEKLSQKLNGSGIGFKPLDQSAIDDMIGNLYIDDTYKLIRESIKLAKTKNQKPDQLDVWYQRLIDTFRTNRFKRFFIPIFKTYQLILEENGTIDFEDMVNQSAGLLAGLKPEAEQARFGGYRYIFVDEFQDISIGRSNFLHRLSGDASLFCVGDDWQSIYRFTGADNSIIRSFTDIFKFPIKLSARSNEGKITEVSISLENLENPKKKEYISQLYINDATNQKGLDLSLLKDLPHETFKIQNNFRTGDVINDIASIFIQKNPFQIAKEVKTTNKLDKKQSQQAINFCQVSQYDNASIQKIIDFIPKDDQEKEVFILGRTKYDFEDVKPALLMGNRNDLSIIKSTIHKAKGLEADVVIVLGLDGGIKGFPNKTAEDPLLSAFLPSSDDYEDSEERRVMYVAVTRAKQMIFFVYKLQNPSSFVDELIEICESTATHYNEIVLSKGIKACPECEKKGKNGYLTMKRNQRGNPNIFLGCIFWRPIKDDLFCGHIQEHVPCLDCMSEGNDSELYVSDNNGEHFILCENCDYKENYYSS